MYVQESDENNHKKKGTYSGNPFVNSLPWGKEAESAVSHAIGASVDAAEKAVGWAGDAYEAIMPKNFGYAQTYHDDTADRKGRDQANAGDYYKAGRIVKGVGSIMRDSYQASRYENTYGGYRGTNWDTLNFAEREKTHPDREVFRKLAEEAEKKNWGNYYDHYYGIYPDKHAAFKREMQSRFYRRNWRARKQWRSRYYNNRRRWRRRWPKTYQY